ncbi:hypothetical protein QTP88_029215 [Uroleucon formosanum]
MKEKKTDILCISEPNGVPDQPGWVGSADGKCALYLNENLRVLRIGKEAGFAWADLDNLRVYSCYYSPNCTLQEYQKFIDALHESVREAAGGVIVCGDFNAHSQVWGSRATDKRGEALLEMAESRNLVVINDGMVPTFPRGSSFLDLTLATPRYSTKNRLMGITRDRIIERSSIHTLHPDVAEEDNASSKEWVGLEKTGHRKAGLIHSKQIRQSKENSWRELCNQVETDPWGIPYKVATKNIIGRRPITGITIPGRLELIVDTLFPIHQPLIWPETEAPEEIPLITRQEVEPIARGLPGNKAPGPDRIPDIIVKHMILKRSELILGTLNKCLTQGIFPTPWKEATLVLLPKGNKPLDQPSSYRPICLLNTIGKVFERIIKKRLEAHLKVTRGISSHQFVFMKGRSTIDAIKMATNVI